MKNILSILGLQKNPNITGIKEIKSKVQGVINESIGSATIQSFYQMCCDDQEPDDGITNFLVILNPQKRTKDKPTPFLSGKGKELKIKRLDPKKILMNFII